MLRLQEFLVCVCGACMRLIDWPSCSSDFVIFTETEPGLHTLGTRCTSITAFVSIILVVLNDSIRH